MSRTFPRLRSGTSLKSVRRIASLIGAASFHAPPRPVNFAGAFDRRSRFLYMVGMRFGLNGRALRAALAVLLLWGGGAQDAGAVAVSAVEGTIADSQDHPIEEALVTLRGTRGGVVTTRTDVQGSFRFPGVAAGETYVLQVEADGFRGIAYEGF